MHRAWLFLLMWVPVAVFATSYKPRIEQVSHVIPVDIPFDFNQPSSTPIELPGFDNADGTLMRIEIAFDGLYIENIYLVYPLTPEGGVLGRYTISTTFDYRSQNGPIIECRDGGTDICEGGSEIDGQLYCSNDGRAETIIEEISFNHSWNPALVNGLESEFLNVGDGEPATVKWPTKTVIVPPDFSYEVPIKEKLEDAGGTVYFENNYRVDPASYDSGSAEYSGNLTVTYSYDAKTALAYALEILEAVRKAGNSEVEIAELFYQQAIQARENAYPGATLNENLRKVEYFGRGFHGAALLRSKSFSDIFLGDPNNIPNLAVPVSEPIYNFLKKYGLYGAENENPQSAAIDSDDARNGWGLGMAGIGLEEALRWEFQDPKPTEPPENLDNIFNFPDTPPSSEGSPLGSAGEIAIPVSETAATPTDLFFLNNQQGDIVHLSGSNESPGTGAISTIGPAYANLKLGSRNQDSSEFFIAIQGAFAGSFSIPDLDGTPDAFQIDLGSGFEERLEGEVINLPVPSDDADYQAISLQNVTPDKRDIQIQLKFAESGGSPVSITEVALKPIDDFFLRLGLASTTAGISLRVTGPAHRNPVVFKSSGLENWTLFDPVNGFSGDTRIPLNEDILHFPVFFHVADGDSE